MVKLWHESGFEEKAIKCKGQAILLLVWRKPGNNRLLELCQQVKN